MSKVLHRLESWSTVNMRSVLLVLILVKSFQRLKCTCDCCFEEGLSFRKHHDGYGETVNEAAKN